VQKLVTDPRQKSQERATSPQHTLKNEGIMYYTTSDFNFNKEASIESSSIHVPPTRWIYKVTGNSPAYLVRFVARPLQINRAFHYRSSLSRCLGPPVIPPRSPRRGVGAYAGQPLRVTYKMVRGLPLCRGLWAELPWEGTYVVSNRVSPSLKRDPAGNNPTNKNGPRGSRSHPSLSKSLGLCPQCGVAP
jgi:hypothetical protein